IIQVTEWLGISIRLPCNHSMTSCIEVPQFITSPTASGYPSPHGEGKTDILATLSVRRGAGGEVR
ncbi:hypothetical protein KAH37_01135, partial [bacterium]|nr:hypothetical protein [bacterium]